MLLVFFFFMHTASKAASLKRGTRARGTPPQQLPKQQAGTMPSAERWWNDAFACVQDRYIRTIDAMQ